MNQKTLKLKTIFGVLSLLASMVTAAVALVVYIMNLLDALGLFGNNYMYSSSGALIYSLITINFEIVAVAAVVGLWFIGSILYIVACRNDLKAANAAIAPAIAVAPVAAAPVEAAAPIEEAVPAKLAEEVKEEAAAPQKPDNAAKLAEMLDNGLITEEEYKEMCKSYEA